MSSSAGDFRQTSPPRCSRFTEPSFKVISHSGHQEEIASLAISTRYRHETVQLPSTQQLQFTRPSRTPKLSCRRRCWIGRCRGASNGSCERRRWTPIGASSWKKHRLAIKSVQKGWGGPFGAVIVKDGEIIGHNQEQGPPHRLPRVPRRSHRHHRRIKPIEPEGAARQRLWPGDDAGIDPRPVGLPDLVPERAKMLKGCEIYINGAPCPMCMSAIYWSRIDHLYFAPASRTRATSDSRTIPIPRLQAALGPAEGDRGDAELRAGNGACSVPSLGK